jgi:hypothetical protein
MAEDKTGQRGAGASPSFDVSLDFGLAQVQHLLAKKDRIGVAFP